MKNISIVLLLLLVCSAARGQETLTDSVHGHALEGAMHLNEIVVTGSMGQTLLKQSPFAMTVIDNKELSSEPSTNIIDAISHQPGMSQVTTGGGISKPVIRGLGYNRVLVVNDGVRQEGQQWGDEHGVEIDGESVNSVEVFKGPASLLYGSDALAGVIVMESSPIMLEGTRRLGGILEYQTNNGLFGYSADYKGNSQGFVWDWRLSGKYSHSYKNKYDGYVYGTGFRDMGLKCMTGYNGRWGYTHLILSHYNLRPCIAEGERDEITGELIGSGAKSYHSILPYQQIHHYKCVLDNMFYLGEGNLKVILSYQQNRREEFEESKDESGLNFRLHTIGYTMRYLSPVVSGWKLSGGINGMYQKSDNLGTEYLIPSYNLFDFGAYGTVSRMLSERVNVTGGLRYDTRHLHSHSLEDDGELRFSTFSRTFSGLTGSVGLTAELAKELNCKFNLSRGFRAPNMSELGSNGEHEGTLRYELGNHDLKNEESFQVDMGLDYSSSLFSVGLSLFGNFIDNYIFLERQSTEDGGEYQIDDTPVYQFMSGDARLLGGEIMVDVHPLRCLHIGTSLSYVDAVQLHQDRQSKYLPFTPAPRWNADVKYDIMHGGKKSLGNVFVKLGLEHYFKQDHCHLVNGTETPTPSYTLLNAQLGGDVNVRGKRLCTLYLSCVNLGDVAYQSHLSRLKYGDVNAVTGRMGIYDMGRNFMFKIVL